MFVSACAELRQLRFYGNQLAAFVKPVDVRQAEFSGVNIYEPIRSQSDSVKVDAIRRLNNCVNEAKQRCKSRSLRLKHGVKQRKILTALEEDVSPQNRIIEIYEQ